MSANVDPQEVEALTEGLASAPSGEHAARDFAQPLRLGQARLAAFRRRVEGMEFPLTKHVTDQLGVATEVKLVDAREVHADVVREGLEDPLAAVRFRCGGQIGWAVWDADAAVHAIEQLLCGSSPTEGPRRLSGLEADLLVAILGKPIERLAEAGDVAVESVQAVTNLSSLGSWQELGSAADPHRVALDFELKAGDESSELHVYLPGFSNDGQAPEAPAEALPEHLDPVAIELSVRLGAAEIPLSELLALEDGDVIPLGTPTNGTVAVTVDGWELARARLGQSEGKLAIALTEVIQPEAAPPADEGATDD
ncbi:MAG: FliM/FliN family flagellar motor switch protein [Planctomycetota bacterium]